MSRSHGLTCRSAWKAAPKTKEKAPWVGPKRLGSLKEGTILTGHDGITFWSVLMWDIYECLGYRPITWCLPCCLCIPCRFGPYYWINWRPCHVPTSFSLATTCILRLGRDLGWRSWGPSRIGIRLVDRWCPSASGAGGSCQVCDRVVESPILW